MWYVFTSIFYFIGLFHDSVLIAYRMYLILSLGSKLFVTIRAMIMFLDIISIFVTAIPKSIKFKLNDSHDDPIIRKRERQGLGRQTTPIIPGLKLKKIDNTKRQ